MLKRIHLTGQWLFLRVERLFNRLFGDRLNPLYHLGAISYWMFWVVVASGLYIYAFYETGLDTTYASVEAITHKQWYLGGLLRSVHRYASDAMVLTMFLHLLRHFFFDQYRNFRAFSWITGVLLIWLVYASGINGYMLPWDRMAQFVVIATAEWFDALPVFRGNLIRNFIFPEAVSDRFFSLLQFIHIGIPLAVLVGLWVHTQRVPRARTSPPRPLAISLGVLLVSVSIVKPAVSQGPAEFTGAPALLHFDWFYLAVYPLLYSWSPAKVWMLVGGCTILFLLLPWLPPKRRGRAGALNLTLHPGNRRIPIREAETLLDAGLRAGVALPFDCRSGGCGACKAHLLNGEIEHAACQASALSAAEREHGLVLLCCATPTSDVEVEYEEGAAVRDGPVPVYAARLERIERLAPDVMLLGLRLPKNQTIQFEPGQYINILLEDGGRRSYSFTAAESPVDLIELHVRRMPEGRFTTHVFEKMKVGDLLRFEGPLGSFVLHEPSEKPLIFVAGATGFAPVKSLLESAFKRGIRRPLYFYWGVRKERDLYLRELPGRWEREHANFRFVPVLSEPEPGDGWTGRTGLVHEAILADFPDLSGFSIYACGSMNMVHGARPAFVAQGLGEDACYSDAFTPQTQAPAPPAAAPPMNRAN